MGDVEAEGLAGSVALVVVFAVVEFAVDIGCVVGGEFGLGVGAVPGFGAEDPEYAVFAAVGGDGGGGAKAGYAVSASGGAGELDVGEAEGLDGVVIAAA